MATILSNPFKRNRAPESITDNYIDGMMITPRGVHSVKGYAGTPNFYYFNDIPTDAQLTPTLSGVAFAFSASVWIYRCAWARANAVAGIPLLVLDSEENELTQSPLARLLAPLNRDMQKRIELDLCIFGHAFGKPYYDGRRWSIRRWNPQTVQIVPGPGGYGIAKYIQRVGGYVTEAFPDEIVHYRYYDPNNDFGSISPALAALRAVQADVGAWDYVVSFFANDATPSLFITTEAQMQLPDIDRIAAQWSKDHQGARKSHKPKFGHKGMTVVQLQNAMKDLVIPELDEGIKTRICAAMGVPLTVALATEAANYACLPAGELVYTPNGPLPIETVQEGQEVYSWHENGLRTQKVTASIKQPSQAKVYEIKTRHRTLRASDNHLVLTIKIIAGSPNVRQRNEYEWKRVDELERGDYIVETWCLPATHGDTLPNGTKATVGFMELAGLYLSDGNSSDRDLHFAVPDDEMGNYYQSIADSTFSYSRPHLADTPFKSRRRAKTFGFTVGSASALKLFTELGLTGTAYTKRVPNWVFGLSHELRLAFLRGYLDGDGSVGDRGAVWAGSNDFMINQVRVLAISCGLRVTNMQYSDRVTNFGDNHIARFYARDAHLIGSNDPRYQVRIEKSRTKETQYGVTNTYAGYVKELVLPDGLALGRVQSVDYVGKMEVYDLTIENDHTFVANGIVVHNTADISRKAFYTEQILPELDMITDEMNRQLVPIICRYEHDKPTVTYDKDDIEALQGTPLEKSQRAQMGYQSGVRSLNESRELEDLPPLPVDYFLVGGQLVPRNEVEVGQLPIITPPSLFNLPPTANYNLARLSQAPNVIDMPLANKALYSSILTELKQWQNKALNRGTKSTFKAEFIPPATAAFIKMDLQALYSDSFDITAQVKAIFSGVEAAFKQLDTDLATPEEFEEYWQGFDTAYDDIQALFADYFATLPSHMANTVRNGSPLITLDDASLVDLLMGTPDAPGPLMVSFLAGTVRGNELYNRAKAMKQGGVGIAWDILSQEAIDYARNYAFGMVQGINQTTQKIYQDAMATWLEDGGTLTDLADVIEGQLPANIPPNWTGGKLAWATSPERAYLIAQQESAMAYQQGVTQRWSQLGVNKARFRTANDARVCVEICKPLNNQEGNLVNGQYVWILNGQSYTIPAHIGCRCFAAVIL